MTARSAVGVDVGGTKLLAAVVDATGAVISRGTAATPWQAGPAAVLDAVAALVRSLPPASTDGVLGVGCTGHVDPHTGRVLSSTDAIVDWAGTDLAGGLSARLGGVRVRALNDVQAFAVGEAALGAADGCTDVLAAMVGTGIGGGLVCDRRLVTGSHAAAGHLGHVPAAEAAGIRCSCGVMGHIEALASGRGLLIAYRRAGGVADDLPDVATRADAGEPLAVEVLAQAGAALGRVLGGLVSTLDPEVVVLGGGVVAAGQGFLGPLRTSVAASTLPSLSAVPVREAQLGPDGVVVGAALWASGRLS